MRYGDMHNGTCLLFLGVRHMLQNPPTRSLEEGMDCRRCTYVRVCVCVCAREKQTGRKEETKKKRGKGKLKRLGAVPFFFFCSSLDFVLLETTKQCQVFSLS